MFNSIVLCIGIIFGSAPALAEAVSPAPQWMLKCDEAAMAEARDKIGYNPYFWSDMTARLDSIEANQLTYQVFAGPVSLTVVVPAKPEVAPDGSKNFICD